MGVPSWARDPRQSRTVEKETKNVKAFYRTVHTGFLFSTPMGHLVSRERFRSSTCHASALLRPWLYTYFCCLRRRRGRTVLWQRPATKKTKKKTKFLLPCANFTNKNRSINIQKNPKLVLRFFLYLQIFPKFYLDFYQTWLSTFFNFLCLIFFSTWSKASTSA